MGDEKNFRSQFYKKYKKVGLREVEEKRALEALLKEQPLDVVRLATFCCRSAVPAAHRHLVWKLLLQVVPRHAESHDYVRQQQRLTYEELWRAVSSLGLTGYMDVSALTSACDGHYEYNNHNYYHHPRRTGSRPDAPWPEDQLFMWLVSRGLLLHPPGELLRQPESQQYLAIVRKTAGLMDCPVDVFWVSSAVWSLLRDNREAVAAAVKEAAGTLRREHQALHSHLVRINVFSSGLLMDLCLSLFFDIFPDSAMEKVLDKVVAGAFGLLGCLTAALLLHLHQPLTIATTATGVKSVLSGMRKEEAEMVVATALEQWLKAVVDRKQ
ncbi:TBC1 domain family member 7 [Chionoecetes opilio]|uniref:TBC1 domain family member 7 n=1 Tax=Chionoecetes opilio TaxID=41210 RepID=A0A8J4XXR2_CHIOP|nr:TBC1 domain family member 7 [Chionoecetes opilio]